jgi:hypothetical protein
MVSSPARTDARLFSYRSYRAYSALVLLWSVPAPWPAWTRTQPEGALLLAGAGAALYTLARGRRPIALSIAMAGLIVAGVELAAHVAGGASSRRRGASSRCG